MKRNRESKYRQKLINCLHKNKSQQKDLDKIVQKYGVAYYAMYQVAVKHNHSQLRDMIHKMVECEMDKVFKSFGDMSEFPLDLFEQTNHKRPYYLGVDLTKGNDWIGKIELEGKENRL